MRLSLLCGALLLPLPLLAAEPLSNAGMAKTYVPGSTPCLTQKGKANKKGCDPSATRAVTDKAVRDAQQQGANLPLTNPQITNPDLQQVPRELPPPPPREIPQPLMDQMIHPAPAVPAP
jgi:hypothetical protein